MKHYHHLSSQTMNPYNLVRESYQKAIHTWLCNGCKLPKPGVAELDVILDDPRVNKVPLNFVGGCGVGVARKDFLFSFGEDLVRRDLFLGRVYGSDGKEISKLVTFRGKYCVIVRGRKHAGFRMCPECGRPVYFSMIGGRFLFPEPPQTALLLESQGGGLVMPHEVFRHIDLSQWRKVTNEVLSVPESPPDGFFDLHSIEDRRLASPNHS